MARHFLFSLLFTAFPIRIWCQTVQDQWTSPTTPDGSTSLQSNIPFTIQWKSGLKNIFRPCCTSCNTSKLDLWVTSFTNNDYKFKLASDINITATSSYQWNMNLPYDALSANNFWVLRFTPCGYTQPFTQQISSPGFFILGPPKPSTVTRLITLPPSSTTTSLSQISTSENPSRNDNSPAQPNRKAWIAGVVIGPIAGIALGAALTWYLLGKKRKIENTRIDQNSTGHAYQIGFPMPIHLQASELYDDARVEVPVAAPETPAGPAELWYGNYTSRI